MGRYTLKDLSQIREERREEREAAIEQLENDVVERRTEHLAERRHIQRFSHWEHTTHAAGIQGAEDIQRAQVMQGEAHARLQAELDGARAMFAEEHVALRSCRAMHLRTEAYRERLGQDVCFDLDAMQSRLIAEGRKGQAWSGRVVQLRQALVSQYESREIEARVVLESAGHALAEEAAVAQLHDEAADRAVTTAHVLRELRMEAESQTEQALRNRVLLEADDARREMAAYDYDKRVMAWRYAEQKASTKLPPPAIPMRAPVAVANVRGNQTSDGGSRPMERLVALLP